MRYYHLGVFWSRGATSEKQRGINDALNAFAVDWLRYSDSGWIVYAESADRVHIGVREKIGQHDQFVVLPIDEKGDRQGLLSPWIWEWLKVDRTQPGWATRVAAILSSLQPAPTPAPTVTLPPSILQYLLSLPPPKPPSGGQ